MPNSKVNLQRLLAATTPEQRRRLFQSFDNRDLLALRYLWFLWAREKQLPPSGPWQVWLLMAGRGFGKTRAGAEWIRALAEGSGQPELGLVGATFDDVRQVMVEGPSGILSISPAAMRPQWMVSRRLLMWPNGVRATVFSADRPDQLRGPEFGYVWADEIAKWRYEETWTNLRLCMRKGQNPQIMATTTPRPKEWLKQLAEAKSTRLVTGSSIENAANLAPGFAENLRSQLHSKDLIRQELEGVLPSVYAGALWSRGQLASLTYPMPERRTLSRCVVGVDPAIGGGDKTGIIVAGKDTDGRYWVLEDVSCHADGEVWAALSQRRQHQLNHLALQQRSVYLAGWRPLAGWACALGVAWVFLGAPLAQTLLAVTESDITLPKVPTDHLFELLLGLLGMAGIRSFDKLKGRTDRGDGPEK